MHEVKNRIKEIRKKSKLTQTEFGSLIGITKNAVYDMEQQKYQPNVSTIIAIMKTFGCKFEDVIEMP